MRPPFLLMGGKARMKACGSRLASSSARAARAPRQSRKSSVLVARTCLTEPQRADRPAHHSTDGGASSRASLSRPSFGAGISTVVVSRRVRRFASIPIGPTASGTRIWQSSAPVAARRSTCLQVVPSHPCLAVSCCVDAELLAQVQTEVLNKLFPASTDRTASDPYAASLMRTFAYPYPVLAHPFESACSGLLVIEIANQLTGIHAWSGSSMPRKRCGRSPRSIPSTRKRVAASPFSFDLWMA